MFFHSKYYEDLLIQLDYFHNFSLNNILLINSQNPKASMIAGKKSWKNTFNKDLSQSASPINILIPDNVSGVLDKRSVPVFDILDTFPPSISIQKQYNFKELFSQLRKKSPYSFVFDSDTLFCKGIKINEGTDEEMMLSALHGLLSDASSEFVVAHHFGLNTLQFAFKDIEISLDELNTIHSKSHKMICLLDAESSYFTFEEIMLIKKFLSEKDRLQFLDGLYELQTEDDEFDIIIQSLIEKIEAITNEEYNQLYEDKFSHRLSSFFPYMFETT